MDLRCAHKKLAELDLEEKTLDVKCGSRFCGARPGVVVIHRFDAQTGELKETKRFRDPGLTIEEVQVNGSGYDSASLRTT